MRPNQKLLWLSPTIFLLSFFFIYGCQNNSDSFDSGVSDITVGMDPDLTAIHSQSLTSSSRKAGSLFAVTGAVGTMQVTDTSDSSVTNYPWPITYDDATFTLTSNKTIVLSPGIYDFAFLVTINNHQYAGSTSAVTIGDGAGTDIPMTVNAVIGDTDITVAVVSELPEFKFSYSVSELSSLTTPKIGIIIDSGSETILDLNPSTGISNQYISISAGAHTIKLKLYDDALQVGKSVEAQESVTVVAGQDIPMNLVPLSGQAALTLTEEGGDATFNFTVPNEVIIESGGASNLDTIFKMSGTANNPADVTLPTFVDNGDGTSVTFYTHINMQAEDVNLSLEFYDNTNSDLLGSCTMTGVTLDVNGTTALCSIDLVRRAVIQGSILATVGVNVFDTGNNPIAGAIVSEGENTLGLTNSGSFGTQGFLQFNIQAGTYTIRAEDGGLYGEENVTLTALGIVNKDIILNMVVYPKEITAFSFTAAANSALSSDVTATISGTDITATVPYGTDVTALVATFTTTGESVAVSSTTQVSGTTAHDFSNAVTYTVTGADSTTQDYTVTVSVSSLSSCIIGTSLIGSCILSSSS